MIKKLFNSTLKNEDSRLVVAHAHIFKNAGTTIDWILQRNFGRKFLDDRNDHLIRTDVNYVSNLLKKKKKILAFSSHSLPLPVENIEGINLQVMFLLRHPLLRVRSVYDFERKQNADTPGAKFAKKLTFKEYVAWRMTSDSASTIRNMQVRFLTANDQIDTSFGETHLEIALQYIESNPLIGIVEQFDQSMLLFQEHLQTLGVKLNCAYLKQNITDNKKNSDEGKLVQLRSDLGDELFQTLVDNNSLDITLYEYAVTLLSKRFDSLDNSHNKLGDLQNACRSLKTNMLKKW